MTDQSLKSSQGTSTGSTGATSFPELPDGNSPCSWQDGRQTSLFGPPVSPASRSASQGVGMEPPMNDTSGPSSVDWSRHVALAFSLVNRLAQVAAENGSPLYRLTFRRWDMSPLPPIYALRASGRRTCDNDSTGWPTVMTRPKDWSDDAVRRWIDQNPKRGYRTHGLDLGGAVRMAGWRLPRKAHGAMPSGSNVGMDIEGLLSPEFCRWLMGYPDGWTPSSDTEIRSSRNWRPSS